MSLSLKQALFDEYGGFDDKRIKQLDKGSRFTVDDRNDGDLDARGELYLNFCAISAGVVEPANPLFSPTPERPTVWVRLHSGVPRSPGIQSWITSVGAVAGEHSLRFEVVEGQQDILRSLAAAVRAIVAPGAPRYDVPSYKHYCPRTATSLDRLADVLDRAWAK